MSEATTTTTAADTTATTTTADTTATTTAAAPAWHGYTDPADIAYVTNKGWQGAPDAVRSYREVEKLVGRDPNTLLVLPRADDPAGFRAAMTKLGLPETPDKYEVDIPQGEKADDAYVSWAKGTFHKVGLTAAQVKELTKEHNAYVGNMMAQQNKDYEQRVAADKQALLSEWRDGYERMMNSAKAAANTLGFKPETIDAMEKTMGYAGTYKFLAGLGQKLSEDGFVSAGTKQGGFSGMMTPAEAKAEWEAMKTDPIHSKALFDNSHPGHNATKEKQARLFKIMYPE